MQELTEQELVRREKAKKIREMGIDPFGQKFDRDAFAKDITEKYKDVPHDDFEQMNDCYTVPGRIMFIRKMGKASFFTIQDRTGKLQVYISINDVGEEVYTLFKSADIGDIVGVYGKVMKTRTGEVTVNQQSLSNLSESSGIAPWLWEPRGDSYLSLIHYKRRKNYENKSFKRHDQPRNRGILKAPERYLHPCGYGGNP